MKKGSSGMFLACSFFFWLFFFFLASLDVLLKIVLIKKSA